MKLRIDSFQFAGEELDRVGLKMENRGNSTRLDSIRIRLDVTRGLTAFFLDQSDFLVKVSQWLDLIEIYRDFRLEISRLQS